MIESLEIEGFRCFERLRVEGLSPVTLFVGRNNSGKTAILEAIEQLVAPTSTAALVRGSVERGAMLADGVGRWVDVDLRHLFHGHRIAEGTRFVLLVPGHPEMGNSRTVHTLEEDPGSPSPPDGLQLVSGGILAPKLPLSAEGAYRTDPTTSWSAILLAHRPPVGFVTTNRLPPRELARLWARVDLTPAENRVLRAMQIVDPNVRRIRISETETKVLLEGQPGPVPLGTLGEGAARMLTLGLYLAMTEGGYLLIDEIEQGLHWSVMPELWRFLVTAARDLNVQVFATTHSKDCLEGLASLHAADPELASRVSVHRLERGRDTSVRFDASRIAEYVEMELEAR